MPAHTSPLVQRHSTPYPAPYLTYPLGRWGPT